ncbi:MAG TPA: GAF domain-containing protein, partial [Gaiellaceae bacterium]|nr:GAF domain-containing protein [Gaiellaceae bacterium]
MDFDWFFLWLGAALLGLGVLLLWTWWRERRYEGAALPLAAGLLLLGAGGQQLILFEVSLGEERAVASTLFVGVTIVATALATAVWLALASKRGRRSLRQGSQRPQRLRELEVLGAIARLSSQQGSVERIGGAILEAAAPAVGADAAVLLLYDEERRILSGHAASGIPEPEWRNFRIEVSDDFNQQLLQQGKPLVVRDVANERRLKMQLARKLGARSALVVPIRHQSRPVGTLTFYSLATPRKFDGTALAVAELIAKEAGDVLERTRLQEEVLEERERAARVLAHVGDRKSTRLNSSHA